ncbi:MAG: hypothetical protein QXR64_07480 [Pyrobaculum sp.]
MSEETTIFIKRGPLIIKKVIIKKGGRAIGEYIFVKKGLFESEAEYDIEEGVLYYLQLCWLGRCTIWFEGEPDRNPPRQLLEKAKRVFTELAHFSHAAVAVSKLLASYSSRSSPISTSDLSHRPMIY